MRRKLHEEGGFTLTEVLVSMVMMAVVLFALYTMFDAAVRAFGAGRDESGAAQEARIGLARMEREVRAAYPPDKSGGDATLLSAFGETRIVFGNDLDGDRRVSDPEEMVTYATSAGGVPTRNGVRLIEAAGDVDGDGKALTFAYLDEDGAAATEETGVAMVGIRLEVSVDGPAGSGPVEKTLQTTVALRNR